MVNFISNQTTFGLESAVKTNLINLMEVVHMRRILSCFLLMALFVLPFSGCSNGSSDTSKSSSQSASSTKYTLPKYTITGNTVTLLCWNSQSEVDKETGAFYDSNQLLKQNYNCSLKLIRTTYEELPTKAASLVLSGSGPDLIFYKDQDFPNFIKNNIVQDVSKYLDFSNPLFSDLKATADKWKYNNSYYFFPYNTMYNDSYVYYWKSYFEDAGLETPLQLYKAGKWSLDKMQEVMKQLTQDTNHDGVVDIYGLVCHPIYAYHCTGTDFVTLDSKTGKYTNNLKDTHLNAFFDFLYNTSSAGDNSRLMDYNTVADFQAQKGVMMWDQAWCLGTFASQIKEGKIEFAPSPFVQGTDAYYAKGRVDGYWMGKGCSNPGGAAAYLAVCRYMNVDPTLKAKSKEKLKTNSGFTDAMFTLQDEMNSSKFTLTGCISQGVGNWGNDEQWNLWSDVGLYKVPWSSTVQKFYPVLQGEIDKANQ